MFCSECGKQIENDAKFCGECGAVQADVEQAPKAEQKQVASVASNTVLSNVNKRIAGYVVGAILLF